MKRLIGCLILCGAFAVNVFAQVTATPVPPSAQDVMPFQYFTFGEAKIRCLNQGVEKTWSDLCGQVISDVLDGWPGSEYKDLRQFAWVIALFPAAEGSFAVDFWASAPLGNSGFVLMSLAKHYKASIKINLEKPELTALDLYQALFSAYKELRSGLPADWTPPKITPKPAKPAVSGIKVAAANPNLPPRPLGRRQRPKFAKPPTREPWRIFNKKRPLGSYKKIY